MALADSSIAHTASGALLMGGWAFFANAAHPMPASLWAALVQGAMTAVITYGLKRVQEALVPRLPGPAGLLVPPLVCCAMSFGLLFTIHSLAGTPEVLATLALPTTVATLYACAYTWRLWSRD
ncbi:hypothetical protein [Vannielia litorea]|uniref:Uncharacterized protein n=1 Tax=Vannielia litorea TaxID=1217970 RepID=A0A1N6ILP9_9RHOB|nr:hypothetical protein [Vannielia litorea]SIO32921.1 hypothetical protein SAMN05444002_4044 [Vannielia litorea]